MQFSQKVKNNPNATVGASGGFLAVFVTWLTGNVFHWTISAEDGAIMATAISAVALLIGRTGLRGLWSLVMNGSGEPVPASPPQPH
jgi:hypothetical protein